MRADIVLFVATSAVLVLVASTGPALADGMAGKTSPLPPRSPLSKSTPSLQNDRRKRS